MTIPSRAVLSSMGEAQLFDWFWEHAGEQGDRLELLRRMAEVKIQRPEWWNRVPIREQALPPHPEQCWCCLSIERWTYWHHVVAVQHGGNNHVLNLVGICHRCHQRIHPWLPNGTTLEHKRGWVKVGDMVLPVFGRKILPAIEQWQADSDQPF